MVWLRMCGHVIQQQSIFSSLLLLQGMLMYEQCHEVTSAVLNKAQALGQSVFDTVNKKTACNSYFHVSHITHQRQQST